MNAKELLGKWIFERADFEGTTTFSLGRFDWDAYNFLKDGKAQYAYKFKGSVTEPKDVRWEVKDKKIMVIRGDEIFEVVGLNGVVLMMKQEGKLSVRYYRRPVERKGDGRLEEG